MATTDLIGPAMQALLANVQLELSPSVGRAALYPGGEVAWDDCCDGQLWVRLAAILPNPGAGQPCGVMTWTATFGIGVVRCISVLDDEGRAPAPAALTTDTLRMTGDTAALIKAIQCQAIPRAESLTVVRWEPLGPEGGCAGGEWLVSVKFMNCGCE
mgnify:CR=1 FL=1